MSLRVFVGRDNASEEQQFQNACIPIRFLSRVATLPKKAIESVQAAIAPRRESRPDLFFLNHGNRILRQLGSVIEWRTSLDLP